MSENKLESVEYTLYKYGSMTIALTIVLGSKNLNGNRNDPIFTRTYDTDKYLDVNSVTAKYIKFQTYLKIKINNGDRTEYISFNMLDVYLLIDYFKMLHDDAYDKEIFLNDEDGGIFMNSDIPDEDRSYQFEGLASRYMNMTYHIDDNYNPCIMFEVHGAMESLHIDIVNYLARLLESTDFLNLSMNMYGAVQSGSSKSYKLERRDV